MQQAYAQAYILGTQKIISVCGVCGEADGGSGEACFLINTERLSQQDIYSYRLECGLDSEEVNDIIAHVYICILLFS